MAGKKVETLSVKLHMDVIRAARIVSAFRDVSMTDMLSDMLRPQLIEMERQETAKRAEETSSRKPALKKGKATE